MPEEINRVLTDSIAELCFVSENSGVNNLQREGHSIAQIKLVGNVLIDSLQTHRNRAAELNKCRSFGLTRNGYALVTLHRPSNVDDHTKLARLIEGFEKISKIIPAIFPVHPRTRSGVGNIAANGSLIFCEPLGYLDFLSLMLDSKLVITDSGGIQEETTALGIPCLTMRHNTERPSTTDLGTNTLVGESLLQLEKMVSMVLTGSYKKGSRPELWDGKASERIAKILSDQS